MIATDAPEKRLHLRGLDQPRNKIRSSGARALCAALTCASLMLSPTQLLAQQPEPTAVPVADFFRAPQLARPTLSPDGRYLAGAVATGGSRAQLVVFDVKDLKNAKVVAGFADADINQYEWVNDERLVFDVTDRRSGTSRVLAPGLWAVNRDGSDYRQLIDAHWSSGKGSLSWNWRLHSVLSDGSADVMVAGLTINSVGDLVDVQLARLDTTTGRNRNLSLGTADHVFEWTVDRDGEPVFVTTVHEGRVRSYDRRSPDAPWQKWQDEELLGGKFAVPWSVGYDGRLLVLARGDDGVLALHATDAQTHQPLPEPMIHIKGYDFAGRPIYDSQAQRLVGIRYEADTAGTVWLDPQMAAAQKAVDALLPGAVNLLDCARCGSVPEVLVSSFSDRQPPNYYVYNRDTSKLTSIAASRPWIDPRAMGKRNRYRFAARDGLSMPVQVTFPPGERESPAPAVVLVHGGPWVRGTHWDWEETAQFLASRGYLVIEPEFRGSQGYGFKHFQAGWKQWGLAMQDDVADAVQWAAKQGWADVKRVCIAGASYGGYATLMGLVSDDDLYRCGFEWVGVTDIDLLFSITWSDSSEEVKNFGMPRLIGDPVADAAKFRDTSPLAQAARIRRPLLMAYGGADRRVPVEHGTNFRDAVSKTNQNIEWVVYPEEGHGWRMLETNVDFWTRVEKFLARNLNATPK